MLLAGKSIVVTGGNSGIGESIVLAAAAEGANVVVDYVTHPEEATALIARVEAAGGHAIGVRADVSKAADLQAMIQAAVDTYGRLDVLINNAGVAGGWPEAPTTLTPEEVQRVVETNVIGVIRVTNAMLPLLRRSAHPRIVNQSSHVGSLTLQTTPGVDLGGISGAYAPTKTYLNAVTIQYAKELSDTNVLINNACPGYVATDLNAFNGTQTPEQGAAIAIRLATLPDDGPTGGLFDDTGIVPW